MTEKKLKTYETLTWVFFMSQGVNDTTDLMRCQMLCMQLCELCESNNTVTVDMVKNTAGYKSCIHDIPDVLMNDVKIQEMIDF